MTTSAATITATSRRWPRSVNPAVRKDPLYGYAFVSPAVLGFLLFVVVPLAGVFYYSSQDLNAFSGEESFVGLGNYRELVASGTFHRVLANTALFSLAVIPVNVALGLGLAVLVNRRIPGISVFRTVFFLPVAISLVAWSLVWRYLLQERGGVNALLAMVGIDGPNWLSDTRWSMVALIAVQVLKSVGVSMIILLAALQDVPEEIREAALIDGAGSLQVLRRITLPLISPALLMVGILATIDALKAFAQVFLLTQGGPGLSTTILGYYIYDQAFNAFQIGASSAAAVVLFAIVLSLTLLQWRTRRRWVFNDGP